MLCDIGVDVGEPTGNLGVTVWRPSRGKAWEVSMRRTVVLLMTVGLLVGALAAPSVAETTNLEGPVDSWLSDPDGDDGNNGTEQGDPVVGSL